MNSLRSSDEGRRLIWAHVYRQLLRNAVPDSRFDFDFLSFTPDFRDSLSAIERVVGLPCYQSSKTLLVTSDNSLEQFRHRALKDGKTLLVATYRLRRGFVLLNPTQISEGKYALAACLDGMEKPGLGRSLSLAELRENSSIDLCVIGGLAFNRDGVTIWEGHALFEVQWALLQDIKCLVATTPVIAVAHTCQVVDEQQLGVDVIKPNKAGEVQCDFVATPDQVYKVKCPVRLAGSIDFETIDPEALKSIPPLQELKGIRMMEQIMQDGGLVQKERKTMTKSISSEEQMGVDMVEKLMAGYNHN